MQDQAANYASFRSRSPFESMERGMIRAESVGASDVSPITSPATAARRRRRGSLFEEIASVDYGGDAINFPLERAVSLKAIPKPEVGNVLFGDEIGKKVHAESSGEESDDPVEIDFRRRFFSLWWRAAFSPFIWSKKEKVKPWGMRALAKERAQERREWQLERDRISPSIRSLFATSQSALSEQRRAAPRFNYMGKSLSCVSFSERVLMQDAEDQTQNLSVNLSSNLSMSMESVKDGWLKSIPKSGLAWLDRTSTLTNGWEGRAVCHKAWLLRASRAREKLKARLEEEVSNVVGRDLLRHTRDTRRNGSKRRRSSARIITNRPHPSVLNSSATLQSIPHLRSPVSPGELYDEVTQGACLSSFSLSCYTQRPPTSPTADEDASQSAADRLNAQIDENERKIAECNAEISAAWKDYSRGQRKLVQARETLAKIEELSMKRKRLSERKKFLDDEKLEEVKRFMSGVPAEERERAARVILRFVRRKRKKNRGDQVMVTLETGEQRPKITWETVEFKDLVKPPVDDLSNIVRIVSNETEVDQEAVQEMEDQLHQLHLFKGDHESPIHYRYWHLAKACLEERDMAIKVEMMYRAVDNATVETMRCWTLSQRLRALEALEAVRESMAQAVLQSEKLKSAATKAAIRRADDRRWKAIDHLEKCLDYQPGMAFKSQLPPNFSHPESPLASPIESVRPQLDSIWSKQSSSKGNKTGLFTSLAKHRTWRGALPQHMGTYDTGDASRQDSIRSFTQTVVFNNL